jgi:hypothetical protein
MMMGPSIPSPFKVLVPWSLTIKAALCEQRYCDENQTSYGYCIDCSELEGGASINTCSDYPELSPEFLTGLEKLYYTPYYACYPRNDTNSPTTSNPESLGDGTAPTTAPLGNNPSNENDGVTPTITTPPAARTTPTTSQFQ